MNSMHGTLFVVPGEEEDQITLYSPTAPTDAIPAARMLEWTGPQNLSLNDGLPMTADALQGWLNEKKSAGFQFEEISA